jgi:hypothetical protein
MTERKNTNTPKPSPTPSPNRIPFNDANRSRGEKAGNITSEQAPPTRPKR